MLPVSFSGRAIMQRQVLVTGGTGGIGQAIACAFADEGCAVTATGRNSQEAAAADFGRRAIAAHALDVTDASAIAALAAKLERLDVLINCAGIIQREGKEHDPEHFAHTIDVNLNGTMRTCAAFRTHLARQRGCVVNLASMLSFFGSGVAPGYSASKGGIAQLTKSLAIAWAGEGIRVNAVAPGWIETPLTAPLLADPQRRDAIAARTPLGRWGKPADVAGAVLFLCSAQAAFITGAILPVDGGYSIS